jgi:enoyl-CoA hydratase
MIGANEMRTNMVIPIPILELISHRVSSVHKYRAILGAEMYSIENGIDAGLIDEVVDPENLMETVMLKAKDLATMGHPSYTLTKELLIREPLQKINDAISAIESN